METTVILNQVTLKKPDLGHLERAGSLVKDRGIVIHKIKLVEPEPPEMYLAVPLLSYFSRETQILQQRVQPHE